MNIKLASKHATQRLIELFAHGPLGEYIYPLIAQATMHRIRAVSGNSGLKFHVPNSVNKFRVNTFLTKEPETLEWLDRIPLESVVWDIGANIGLYTCYAAMVRKCRVIAFEPSVLNLELLARNINLNNLSDRVTIVPLPISDCLSLSTLNMSSLDLGGAKSTFKEIYGHDGRPIKTLLRVPLVGMSMPELVDFLGLPMPDYIKLDVDGIEHIILGAGGKVLRGAKEVLVEVNDDFVDQAELTAKYLTKAEFVLKEKRHASMFDEAELGSAVLTTFNQIWIRTGNG
jgi:FkbM family methyltransferase